MLKTGFYRYRLLMMRLAAAVCLTVPASLAQATPALLTLQGSGAAANAVATLSVGPAQQLSAKSDLQGNFVFSDLQYASDAPLAFTVSMPVATPDHKIISNTLNISLKPYPGSVEIKGTATRAASIVANLAAEDSKTMVANQKGYFEGKTYTHNGLDDGKMRLTASIVNVSETCCPRAFLPFAPVLLTISSVPAQKASTEITPGSLTSYASASTGSRSYAELVSPALVNNSWVHGVKEFANQAAISLTAKSASLGGFFDAQNNVDSLRALQQSTGQSINHSFPSEQVCRFGSIGLGLSASDASKEANRLSLMKNLSARDLGKKNSLYGLDSNMRDVARISRFRKYCNANEGNGSLDSFCEASDSVDTNYNRDVDYTAIDTADTLQFNLTNQTADPDEEHIIALADNLFPPQLASAMTNTDYLNKQIEFRSLQTIRNVAKNSFASLVAEKASGSANSGTYIPKMLASFGVDDKSAKRLLGENPSYYAQMETLTKKLFQTPAFTVNLMENDANIARQRTAIKAISLQQQHDLLESLKRREMLLAVLLELKIRGRAAGVSTRISTATSGN